MLSDNERIAIAGGLWTPICEMMRQLGVWCPEHIPPDMADAANLLKALENCRFSLTPQTAKDWACYDNHRERWCPIALTPADAIRAALLAKYDAENKP